MNDSSALRPVHTLYADDVPANRRYLRAMLEKLGLNTDVAENGLDALEQWQQRHHPLVLLDIHMPGLDGGEVARRIRMEQAEHENVVILGITADMNDNLREALQLAGMDDCITKPTSGQALQAALQPWLGSESDTAQDDATASMLRQDTELVGRLMEELPSEIAALQTAHQTGDSERLRAGAHQISGIAALYRLPKLRSAMDALQKKLKADQAIEPEDLEQIAGAMADDLVELQSAL